MKFRNPWIDPRVLQVRPDAMAAYLQQLGWQPAGPGANPHLLRFEPPGDDERSPTFYVPREVREGAAIDWMVNLIADLARWQDRYAGDVLTDILTHAGPHAANGATHPAAEEATPAK